MQKAQEAGKYHVYVFEGGSRCFAAGQLVVTDKGSIPIEQLKAGDMVATLDAKGERVFRKVKSLHIYENTKPVVRVKLKNGKEICCTYDHKFFYKGRYVPIIDILQEFENEKHPQL